MMWNEFMEIAGYEVTYEDYTNIIEPMYMATNLTKQEFVKCIDRTRFAVKTAKQIEKELKKVAKHLKETCEHYTDWKAKEQLEKLAHEYKERVGAYSFGFTTGWTYEYLGNCRGCSFVKTVEFFDKQYHTFIELKLV